MGASASALKKRLLERKMTSNLNGVTEVDRALNILLNTRKIRKFEDRPNCYYLLD